MFFLLACYKRDTIMHIFSPWIIYWWKNDHMCCDLAESVRSWEHWLWDKARKRTVFPLFSIVLRILQLLIVLEPQVQFSWDFQQNDLSKLALQSNKKTENVTCSTLDLIPLDHIKYLAVQWKFNFPQILGQAPSITTNTWTSF